MAGGCDVTAPATLDELVSALSSGRRWSLVGSGTKRAWAPQRQEEPLSLSRLSGIVEHRPADQTVVVRAGTTVEELQEALRRHGQCLPLPDPKGHGPAIGGYPGTVGGLLASDMPHGLYAQHGGPRDWVLGAQFVRPGGQVVKSGSRVVKSVAGFDVHRMVVGNWGRWMAIVEVALRVFPIRALQPVVARQEADVPAGCWIVRTLPSQYGKAKGELQAVAADPASCTIWSVTMPRNNGRLLVGPLGERCDDPVASAMRSRLNAVLDPDGVLR